MGLSFTDLATITLGIRISVYKFEEDADIQFIAVILRIK